MKVFVIEQMGSDGNIQYIGDFTTEQRLLNDADLNEIVECAIGRYSPEMVDFIIFYEKRKEADDIRRILVREFYDTTYAYYYDGNGWLYGSFENALNNIKRQL